MNAPLSPDALRRLAPQAEARRVIDAASPSIGRLASAPQDWEQLVSEGHVLGYRARRFGKVLFLPALAVFVAVMLHVAHIAASLFGWQLPLPRLPLPSAAIAVPSFVKDALTYDPESYVDLGGGVRTSYRLAWLADLPRSRGLSAEAWSDLVKAVGTDIAAARAETDRWTATPALATAPKVTRPAKAISEHSARLSTGIVTVPAASDPQRAHVVAMVDGGLAWATLGPAGCTVPFGPIPANSPCRRTPAGPELNDLRPASK